MKIVCDKCSTKYSIADDKVRGKVFKIRCKKCSHIIVVKGTESGAQAGAEDSSEGAGVEAGAPDAAEKATEKVWYLVVSGDQIGPLSVDEVKARFSLGEIDAETYGWREGFADWLRVGSIDELAAAVGVGSANGHAGNGADTRRVDMNDVFAGHREASPGADLFGAAASPGEDLFGGQSGLSGQAGLPGQSGGLAGGSSDAGLAASSGQHSKLTGERNENSVLFSLNNLSQMATANSSPKPSSPPPSGFGAAEPPRAGYATAKNEGSGLIDIRAMAAATLSAVSSTPGTPSADPIADLPSFSAAAPVFTPVVQAPVMVPQQESGLPKWVWAVIGIGGAALVAAVIAIVLVVTRKPEQIVVAPPPVPAAPTAPVVTPTPARTAPAPTAVAAAQPGAAAAKAAAPAAPPAAVAEKEAAPAHETARERREHRGARGRHGGRHAIAEAAPASQPHRAVAAAPSHASHKASGGGESLDELLDSVPGGSGGSTHHRSAPAPAANANLPDQLDRSQVAAGMRSARVRACFDKYRVPGTVIVKFMIGRSGRVTSAETKGPLAGTPTGDCAAHAVKAVHFPAFKGQPMSISFPFILR